MALLTIDLLPQAACIASGEPLGCGVLAGQHGDQEVTFPLQALDMKARLSGPMASVQVKQTFGNPYSDPIEAVYIFPLPAGSAVYRFRMQVKDRIVDGVVQERAQARATYAEGVRQGHRSALMEMERDNVFTVHVGNLPPGESVSIDMTYAQRVEINEAENTFRFPLVVAPRYIPGSDLPRVSVGDGTSPDTNRVPDASRITPPMLLPGLKSGVNLSLQVAIETGGMMPARLACSQHAINQSGQNGDLVIELSRTDELLDRDFVLRYRLADAQPRALLLASDRHFMLTVLPPATSPARTIGRDVAIILDRSGSMGGVKIESARRAVGRFLQTLGPDDRFALLAFDDRVESFRQSAWHDNRSIHDATLWLNGIEARGGTEILTALTTALRLPTDSRRLACALLITDGEVGNEGEMFQFVQRSKSPMRLFTLGIDTAVNDAFLRRLAQLGRGTCELVTPGEALESSIERLSKEIGTPIITQVSITGFGIVPDTVVPDAIPDLFAARPIVVLGQHTAGQTMNVQGHLATHDMVAWNESVSAIHTDNTALGVMWARERVTTLEDRLRLESGLTRAEIEKQILDLALEYQLLTRFTAFVLVDRVEVIDRASDARTVVQPVQAAAEWDMLDKANSAVPKPGAKMVKKALGGAHRGSPMPQAPLLARRDALQAPPPMAPAPRGMAGGYDPFCAPASSDPFCASPPPPPEFGASLWSSGAGAASLAFDAPAQAQAPMPLSEPLSAPSTAPPPRVSGYFAARSAASPAPPAPPPPPTLSAEVDAFSQRWMEVRTSPLPLPADVLTLLRMMLITMQTHPGVKPLHGDGLKLVTDLENGVDSARERLNDWLGKVRSGLGLPSLDSWWSNTI